MIAVYKAKWAITVHHRNAQKLAIEMYKVKNELCWKIMVDLFKEVKHPHNFRKSLIAEVFTKSKLHVYLGPKNF